MNDYHLHIRRQKYKFWYNKFKKIADKTLYYPKPYKRQKNLSKKERKLFFERCSKWKFKNINLKIDKSAAENEEIISILFEYKNIPMFKIASYSRIIISDFGRSGHYYWINTKTPEQLYSFIDEYSKHFQNLLNEWNEIEKELLKEKKISEIANTNIKIFIDNLLKETEYQYCIEENKKSTLIKIKLKRKQQIEFSLSHKNFAQEISKILPAIKEINKTLEKTDIKFKITNYGNNVNWRN